MLGNIFRFLSVEELALLLRDGRVSAVPPIGKPLHSDNIPDSPVTGDLLYAFREFSAFRFPQIEYCHLPAVFLPAELAVGTGLARYWVSGPFRLETEPAYYDYAEAYLRGYSLSDVRAIAWVGDGPDDSYAMDWILEHYCDSLWNGFRDDPEAVQRELLYGDPNDPWWLETDNIDMDECGIRPVDVVRAIRHLISVPIAERPRHFGNPVRFHRPPSLAERLQRNQGRRGR